MKRCNYKCKIVAFLLMVVLMLNDFMHISFTQNVLADTENRSLSGVDEQLNSSELQKLFYGYNVTSGKDLVEPDALNTTYPIIDPNSEYLNNVVCFNSTAGDSRSYSGSTQSEVLSKYVFDSAASTFGKIYMVDAEITASFNTSEKVRNAYSEYYQIYSKWIERHHYIVQLSTEEIRGYLADKFKQDLYSIKSDKDAKKLISLYGTHLNTGYSFGGRMNVTNYMSSSDYSTDYSQSMSLGTMLQAKYSVFDFGAGAELSEQYETQVNTDVDSSSFMCKVYGGDPSVPNNVDELFEKYESVWDGLQSSGYGYEKWVNSVNADKNLVIINIPNGAQSIPLWELLDDYDERTPEIRKYLIDAYIELCGDKYEEYQSKYTQLERRVYKENASSVFPTFNGAYVRTLYDYFYYVEADDFATGESHNGIYQSNYLYFDFDYLDNKQDITYECQGCEIIDNNKAIFRVTGSAGSKLMITMKIGDDKWPIVVLPILEANFEGGMGTEKYPYILTSAEHLKKVSRNLSAYYILCKDLDFQGGELPSLGDFSGVFDGNYCTISNFKIPQSQKWGMFARNTGTIKNLCIHDAGSSSNDNGFSLGGTNYSVDCEKDIYTNNSIQATKAGIICAENSGVIDNCSIYNVYIRNVIKDETKYIVNDKVEMSVGVIAGVNLSGGDITDCLVRDSRVLTSFICKEDDRNIDISVFSGGIVGILDGGKINACVYDSGTKGTLMSQGIILYENAWKDTDNSLKVFSGGIAGYLTNDGTINKVYSYVRSVPQDSEYRSIDAEYNILNKFAEPEIYYALRNSAVVCDANSNASITNSYAYSSDDSIEYDCIKPTKNGHNRDKDDKKSYTTIGCFGEKKINSEVDLNSIGFSGGNYFYDASSSSVSHVGHRLLQNRKDYIRISIDRSENDYLSTFYEDEMFTLKNIDVVRQIGQNSTESINIYKLNLKKSDGSSALNKKLDSTQTNDYYLEVWLYGDEKTAPKEYLKIKPNEMVGIIVENENDDYQIYYDEITEYFDNWNPSDINISILMANGDKFPLEGDDEKAIRLNTTNKNITTGENYVYVEYRYGSYDFSTSYILNVKQRNVEAIKIITPPVNTEYEVGDKIDLTGIEVQVTYDEGDDRIISGKNVAEKLEIIGKSVPDGKSMVKVSYLDYSSNNLAEFEITGKAKTVPIEPDLPNDITPTPILSETDEVEDVNGNGSWFVVAGIIVIVVGIGVFFILKNRKKKNETEDVVNSDGKDQEESKNND